MERPVTVAAQLIHAKPVCRTTAARRPVGDCLVLPVVLCCARIDAEPLRAVLPALASGGLIPRVLPGIDEHESMLADILDETRAPTVFVVVASPALPPSRQRALAEAFARGRGAQHRLIVVELDVRQPHALVTPIRRATDSIRRRVASVSPGEPEAQRRLLRDEVGRIPASIHVPHAAPRRRIAALGNAVTSPREPEGRPTPVRVDADAPTRRDLAPAVAIEPAANSDPRTAVHEGGSESSAATPRWAVAVALIECLGSAFSLVS